MEGNGIFENLRGNRREKRRDNIEKEHNIELSLNLSLNLFSFLSSWNPSNFEIVSSVRKKFYSNICSVFCFLFWQSTFLYLLWQNMCEKYSSCVLDYLVWKLRFLMEESC